MAFQSFPQMPSTSSLLSVYASMTTSIMLFRTMFDQLVPPQVRTYIIDGVKYYWKPKTTSKVTLVIPQEFSNDMFYAAEIYLTRITPDSDQCLRITKSEKENQINVGLGGPVEIVDSFEGIPITWNYYSTQEQRKDDGQSYMVEKKHIELKFDKNYKDTIILSYLPLIINKSQEIKNQKKVVQLHNLKSKHAGSLPMKQTVKLDHPSTFDTLAMDPKLKKSIIDDLDLFVKRRDFYKKVGKAWKRGYLLYGPPGTGKSSLIAAMANYLKFDIYDLQLSNVQNDSTLKDMLLYTSNRSILVIEDIDCSVKLPNRKIINAMTNQPRHDDPKFSLSGLLNFIDGLWSCCGDERIIIFTTNHKERLDPALLRPGRMDVHIHMTYLTFDGFKTLAANYLNIHDHHWRFREIKNLIECKKVTPAQVAEELMKSDNVEVVLEGLTKFLKRKKKDADETDHEIIEIDEDNEVSEAKRPKLNHDSRIILTNDQGGEFVEEEDC